MEEKTGSFKAAKKRGGFNAVDLLIVLVLVGIIALFVVSNFVNKDTAGETVEIEYVLLIEGVDEDFINKINVGDKAFDAFGDFLLGRVSAVDYTEHYAVYEHDSESGEIIATEYPDKYNVRVTLSSENATFEDTVGYSVSGRRVSVGGKVEVRFPSYAAEGYCVEFKEVK